MRQRAGWALAGATLGIVMLAGGCQSTTGPGAVLARHGPASDKGQGVFVLKEGIEVDWNVKPAKANPNLILSGHSVVGPDGKIEMGPYGPCFVAGLTIPKASAAIEQHLAHYISGPSVTITTQTQPPSAASIAWRPTEATGVGPKNGGKFYAVGFQQKDGDVPPLGDKDKALETIPAPQAVGPDMKMPPHYLGIHSGPGYHTAPNELNPMLLPPYVIGPTDVLQIESLEGLVTQKVRGPHLVGPDGAVRVGIYGPVPVAGKTLDEAKVAIGQTIFARLDDKIKTLQNILDGLSVDVLAYNSKTFYIITDGGGQGEQVISLPVTGNDTVLNAMAKINGLPVQSSKYRVWVARVNSPGGPETILPVDWIGITQRGAAATNWQLMPGDRIYVHSDPFIRAGTVIAKVLHPFERILGITLLGSQTVNSIRTGTVGGTR